MNLQLSSNFPSTGPIPGILMPGKILTMKVTTRRGNATGQETRAATNMSVRTKHSRSKRSKRCMKAIHIAYIEGFEAGNVVAMILLGVFPLGLNIQLFSPLRSRRQSSLRSSVAVLPSSGRTKRSEGPLVRSPTKPSSAAETGSVERRLSMISLNQTFFALACERLTGNING